jgi:hypothetical protein
MASAGPSMTRRAAPRRGGLAAIIDHPADAMSCGTQVGTEEWYLRSNKGIIAQGRADIACLAD